MVDELWAQPGSSDIDVTIGDFATARVARTFTVAYSVRNTIMNLTTQDAQVECFRNVADHLSPVAASQSKLSSRRGNDSTPARLWFRSTSDRRISGSTRSMSSPRTQFRTTTGSSTVKRGTSPHHLDTCGRPNSTSWPNLRECDYGSDWATGIGHPSRAPTEVTSQCSRRPQKPQAAAECSLRWGRRAPIRSGRLNPPCHFADVRSHVPLPACWLLSHMQSVRTGWCQCCGGRSAARYTTGAVTRTVGCAPARTAALCRSQRAAVTLPLTSLWTVGIASH